LRWVIINSSLVSIFLGSLIRQFLSKKYVKDHSPWRTYSKSRHLWFSPLLFLSSFAFICRRSMPFVQQVLAQNKPIFMLYEISQLNLSLEMFVQTNTCAFTGCHEVYTKRKLTNTKLLHVSLYDILRWSQLGGCIWSIIMMR